MNPQEFKKLIKECIIETLETKLLGGGSDVVDTSGNYKIIYHAIDGDDETEYTNLEDVARFLKDRDNGPDYRKNWGLQTDYAQYGFEGFTWNDLLDGDPRSEKTQYKSYLIDLPLKFRWEHKKLQGGMAYSDLWSGYIGGDKGYDYSAQIYLDPPYGDRERFFHIITGGTNGKWLKNEKNLEDAKKAAIEGYVEYKKYLKDTYGENINV